MSGWDIGADRPAPELGEAYAADPVSVAVIGAGYWGPNIVRNFYELPSAELRYVCDTSLDALDNVRRRWPGVARSLTVDEVLSDPGVEAVAIATPVGTHAELAHAALAAGKHVFVEKPLASSSAEAESLIFLANESGLVLMPGHTFLYSPPVTYIRDLIVSGELGEIYFVTMSRLNLGLHQPDVSVLWDLGPHDVSILRYWLAELPTRVSAMSRGCVIPGIPDIAFLHLQFGSGTIANVEVGWLAPTKLRRTVIVGSRKMVVYDDTSAESVRVFDSGVALPHPRSFGEFQLNYRTGDVISPPVPLSEPLYLELADFCNSIRENREPRANAQLGLDVVRVIEALDRSLTAGGFPEVVDHGRGVECA